MCVVTAEYLLHQSRTMGIEMHILKLPEDIMCELLTSWLDMRACARFDSACCSTDHRGVMLDLFRRECTFKSVVFEVDKVSYMKWLCFRSIRSLRAVIRNCAVGCDEYFEMCTQFLRTSGSVIIHLEIVCCSTYVLDLMASYCSSLSRLRLLDCDLEDSFWILLDSNARTLVDLHLAVNYPIIINSNERKCLGHRLRNLSVEDLYGMISDKHLLQIVQVFPNIVCFELQRDELADETIITILDHCREVIDLTIFTGSEYVSASVLLSILGNRKQGYRALNLSSFATDEEVVEAIVNKHAHTLQHIKLYATEDIDNASYIYLLNACTELQTLELGCTCTEGGKLTNILSYIQPNRLKVMKVESSDESLMESVVELTKYTPSLEALSVTSCFDRGEADARIPVQVQQCGFNCPRLKTVIVDGYYDDACYIRIGQSFEVTPTRITINSYFNF